MARDEADWGPEREWVAGAEADMARDGVDVEAGRQWVAGPGADDESVASGPATVIRVDRARLVEAWIEKAQCGDKAAFNSLVRCYEEHLFGLAMKRLDRCDDALDCCQEAMLAAWEAIGTFGGDADGFAGWLARIVLNRCVNRLVQRKAQAAESLDALEISCPDAEVLSDDAPLPEDRAELAEISRVIWCAIDQLPEPFRTVASMDGFEYTYAEIAEATGVSMGTVCSRVFRARAKMRAMLVAAKIQQV